MSTYLLYSILKCRGWLTSTDRVSKLPPRVISLFTGSLSESTAQNLSQKTVHLSQNNVNLDYMNSNRVLSNLSEPGMNSTTAQVLLIENF
jgi:hypothetical protein